MQTIMPNNNGSMTFKARGDGNCAPRSIIQSLLAQGILQDKKEWVIHFIQELINRNKDRVQHAYNLGQPSSFDHFITQYNAVSTLNALDKFSENNFFDFNSDNNSSNNVSIIYYLNACLRQDMLSFHQENPDEKLNSMDEAIQALRKSDDTEHLESLKKLGSHVAVERQVSRYLKEHKVSLFVYDKDGNLQDHINEEIATETLLEPEITIHLLFTSDQKKESLNHYDALLPAEGIKAFKIMLPIEDAEEIQTQDAPLESTPEDETENTPPSSTLATLPEDNNPLIQQEQEESPHLKQMQIKEGETKAKQLQMEEIQSFAERFKSSGNKDNLSFINDVIKGLGLEKELNLEQLSHLGTLDLDKLVGDLQSVIKDLGYSSEFKEKIQHYSFFAPPGRQEIVDTDQTLTSTQAIKCN